MKLLLSIIALLLPVSLKAAEPRPTVEQMQERLRTSESALKASPKSDKAKLEVAKDLNYNVTALLDRKKPADIETGITYASRALKIAEELLKATPPSEEAYLVAWQSLHSLGSLFEVRSQPGDKEKAFDYRLRTVAIAEAQYKGDINSPPRYNMLGNTYYEMISNYEKRGAAGDAAIAYEYGGKLFKLQEAALKAEGFNRTTPTRLAITATTVAGLAEKAQKPNAKQWQERAYDIYAAMEKTAEGLSPQDKSVMEELKKKLGK